MLRCPKLGTAREHLLVFWEILVLGSMRILSCWWESSGTEIGRWGLRSLQGAARKSWGRDGEWSLPLS